jgi:hypothetical protein
VAIQTSWICTIAQQGRGSRLSLALLDLGLQQLQLVTWPSSLEAMQVRFKIIKEHNYQGFE